MARCLQHEVDHLDGKVFLDRLTGEARKSALRALRDPLMLSPVTLTGDLVTLEPLRPEHHDDLVAAASDGRLWELWYTSVPSPETMRGRHRAAQARRGRRRCRSSSAAPTPARWWA